MKNLENGNTMTSEPQILSDNIASPGWMFWKRRRYVVVLMSFFGFFNLYSLRVNLSIAIVAMTQNKTVSVANGNGTIDEWGQDFDWDMNVRGLVLSAYFYGYIVTQLLGGYLATRVGGNYVFGVGVGMTALLTLFTPVATKISVGCLVAIRIIQGFFSGVAFPSIYDVFAKWAPPQERSRITTITFTGNYAGTVITMPLGGFLATYYGWESVFYFFGSLALFWFIIWMLIISRSPAEDRWISENEKQYIAKSFARNKGSQRPKNLPWLSIWTSPAVWAIVAAQFAELWAFYTMLTQLPTFLMDTMSFDLGKTGIVSAFPYFAMAIMLSIGGYYADLLQNKGILTTTQVRKYFNCGAFAGKAFFMVLGAYVLEPITTITCIVLSVGLGGVGWCGWSVNLLDVAPQFAGVLMGITNTFGTVAGIVSPQVTGYLTQNHLDSEWQLVFYIASVVTIIGGIIYWIFATGEVQPWAMAEIEENGDTNAGSSLEETEMTQLNTPEKPKA